MEVGKEVVLIVPAAVWELVSGGWRSSELFVSIFGCVLAI